MSAQIWPPISQDELNEKVEETLTAELTWLLSIVQETLPSLKAGLQECLSLLSLDNPASTLPLTSHRSESVKGIVTRVGTRITKGDIALRLPTLPPPRGSPSFPLHISYPLVLPQLAHLLALLNTTLDIIDIALYTGDPNNGPFVSSQLKLLSDTIDEARQALKGGEDIPGCQWNAVDPSASEIQETFGPDLPPTLAPHLSISDSSLALTIRTLVPAGSGQDALSLTGLSLRTRLGLAQRPQVHDELDQVFEWRGEKVNVKEKVKVESQDPSLMAVGAKLSALGHSVKSWRLKVAVVMGEDVDL
ncbi:uncharacterized protein KY384_001183 [Bacidia gigantensis]|uniref:uncharacterized protein n=1 Tax=Bacidia gigantensis TaxID=2732470 RepID=UPI001D0559D6|nr:uncharacterized protein KY384_001183 [Bacidia gigantensis]KAG8534339.1 hypothetical protein KY384_001183 [Bacidia gigantensis]